jgi:hypothetical protein
VNNTIYQPVGDAVRMASASRSVAEHLLRNNILWVEAGYCISVASDSQVGFSSDYNLLHKGTDPNAHIGFWNSSHADLAQWQAATGFDANSFSADPLFMDRNGADNVLGYTRSAAATTGDATTISCSRPARRPSTAAARGTRRRPTSSATRGTTTRHPEPRLAGL